MSPSDRPHRVTTRCAAITGALLLSFVAAAARAPAQSSEDQIQILREELEALRRRDAETQRLVETLQRRIEELSPPPPLGAAAPSAPEPPPLPAPAVPTSPRRTAAADALDRAIEALDEAQRGATAGRADLVSGQIGGTTLRLVEVSFDTLLAAGASTATDRELRGVQGGAHDPARRGFTLQQAELSFTGAVDPYLTGEAHVVFVPSGVELEEAFMTTSSLPAGLQLELGYFLTEFGQINPLHPHAWHWIDQPVINSRLFGGESLRAPGARVAWLTPLPWFSEVHLGVQDAESGERTVSFVSDEGIGGRPAVARPVRALGDLLYLARWDQFVDITDALGVKLGVSGLHGPNGTGSDGETWIYGADWKVRWRPQTNFRGWPFLIWQTELTKRDYTASAFHARDATPPITNGGHTHGPDDDPGADDEELPEDLAGALLRDAGFYTQLLYGFRYRWAAGVRLEYASGSGPSLGGRQHDPRRDDRTRCSPLLLWQPTEFSRFRLQYNYDRARHLSDRQAHSVWLGAEILYGSHPAHAY